MNNEPEKLSSKNLSAVKVFDIVELLAFAKEPMRLQDISEKLKRSPSTVLRFLIALKECGYVQQNPETLKYYLTFKICTIANMVSENVHLFDIAQPIMKEISAHFGESVCLAIEQDRTIVYIGVVSGPDQMLRTMQRIGNRAPMHCTGVGKMLLLNHSENDIDQLILEKGLPSFTKNTITTKAELSQALQIAKSNDYAFDDEECEIGAKCIAVPIRDYTTKTIAGLSVTGPIFRMTNEKITENLPFLLSKAKELSKILGGN